MRNGPAITAEDMLGPWEEPDFQSSLIDRCRKYWSHPIAELPNNILAMFLRQKIATALVIVEAEKRLLSGFTDGTELYEEELEAALKSAKEQ